MHVLIVPSAPYIPSHRSLSGIFQYHQAMALLRQGHQVGVASFGFKTMRHWWPPGSYPDFERPAENYVVIRKFRRLVLPHRFIKPSLIEPHYMRGFGDVIARYMDDHGVPDIIHAHDYIYAGIAAGNIGIRLNIPVLVTVHSSDLARARVSPALMRRVVESSTEVDATLSVSRNLRARLIGMGVVSRINEVIPNVLDPQCDNYGAFVNARPEASHSDGSFTYINVATMDDNKNQALLVLAFNEVLKLKPLSRLLLVGQGKNKTDLVKLASRLNIGKRVEFLGQLEREELFAHLGKAHCFVLASQFETFGVVLIEAASVGLPIISTKCGGAQDIVDETNGILVDTDNIEQMIEAMLRIQRDAKNYDRAMIRHGVVRRFGEVAFVRQLESVYSSVKK